MVVLVVIRTRIELRAGLLVLVIKDTLMMGLIRCVLIVSIRVSRVLWPLLVLLVMRFCLGKLMLLPIFVNVKYCSMKI